MLALTIELRWVLFEGSDHRHLQYREHFTPVHSSDWQNVPTILVPKIEPVPEVKQTPSHL